MRKLLMPLLLVTAAAINTGCFIPIYSSSRDARTRQLIYISESLRHIPQIWERVWAMEMPDIATPYRTHGGVI
jgi:hypothetical protein